MRTISDNIRTIREFNNLKQETVAKKLNISQQSYSKLENFPEKFSLERLFELSKVLDCSLFELLDISGETLINGNSNLPTTVSIDKNNNEQQNLIINKLSEVQIELNVIKKFIFDNLINSKK